MRSNQEKIIGDVIALLPSLTRGLDVNVKFRHIKDFEFTPECAVFDVVDIDLVHGWLVDPQNKDLVQLFGDKSYNQLVELAISVQSPVKKKPANADKGKQENAAEANTSTNTSTTNASADTQHAQMTRQFLDRTQSQMTYHGLMELYTNVKERQLCVLFRNNHFSVLFKMDRKLYTLMTDAGYADVAELVWEELAEIDGDSIFCDDEFRAVTMADSESDSYSEDDRHHGPSDWEYMSPVSVRVNGRFVRGVFLHWVDNWTCGVGLLRRVARPPYGDDDYQYREVNRCEVASRVISTPPALPDPVVRGEPVDTQSAAAHRAAAERENADLAMALRLQARDDEEQARMMQEHAREQMPALANFLEKKKKKKKKEGGSGCVVM